MIINIDTEERLNRLKDINKAKAQKALAELIDTVKTNQAKELLGIPTEKLDIKDLQAKAAALQCDIDTPTTDKKYQPATINKA